MHRRASPAARASNPTGKTCSGYRYGCLSLHTMIHKKTAPQNRAQAAGNRSALIWERKYRQTAAVSKNGRTRQTAVLTDSREANLVIKINNPASIQTFPAPIQRSFTARRRFGEKYAADSSSYIL